MTNVLIFFPWLDALCGNFKVHALRSVRSAQTQSRDCPGQRLSIADPERTIKRLLDTIFFHIIFAENRSASSFIRGLLADVFDSCFAHCAKRKMKSFVSTK